MNRTTLAAPRARQILAAARKTRALVLGDVMLDQFIWGNVARISPEAPVPIVEFERESFMPGGAANVARNLVSLATPAELIIRVRGLLIALTLLLPLPIRRKREWTMH